MEGSPPMNRSINLESKASPSSKNIQEIPSKIHTLPSLFA